MENFCNIINVLQILSISWIHPHLKHSFFFFYYYLIDHKYSVGYIVLIVSVKF